MEDRYVCVHVLALRVTLDQSIAQVNLATVAAEYTLFRRFFYSKSSFFLFVLYIIIQFILPIIINIKFLLICLHTSKLIL